MDNLILLEQDISFEESLNLFKEFSAKSMDYKFLPPLEAEHKDFGNDFPGSLIYKPQYNNCRFNNSLFKASNGAFSILKEVWFYDCFFEDANFSYGNFEKCHFIKKKNFLIQGTGFNFSLFLDCEFKHINIRGVSFRDINMEKCIFENCIMSDSSFERAKIKDCTFKDLDLRNIGIRYCDFSNIIFDNVIFPILDLTNNIGLFKIIEEQSDRIRFSLGCKKEVGLAEAKQCLLSLIPYFQNTKQYFPILNIFLLNNDLDKVNKMLPIAMEYSIKQFDLDSLQNICHLVANTNSFNEEQLKKIYNLIENLIKPSELPYNLQKGYTVYMDNIRNLLIENPKGYPCARIFLSTEMDCNTLDMLPIIIKDIEKIIHNINSQLSPCIQLTHHSPYEILIVLYGMLPDLLQICQTFYYLFGGIKAFSEIKKSKNEKTKNNVSASSTESDAIITQENISKVDFSIGPLHLKKETMSVVKELKYNIN